MTASHRPPLPESTEFKSFQIKKIEIDGISRSDKKFIYNHFAALLNTSGSLASLTDSIGAKCNALSQLQIIKDCSVSFEDFDGKVKDFSTQSTPVAIKIRIKEKKFKISTGTEIKKDGDLSIGGSASVFNVFGRGEILSVESSLGSPSALTRSSFPISVVFTKPLEYTGKKMFSVELFQSASTTSNSLLPKQFSTAASCPYSYSAAGIAVKFRQTFDRVLHEARASVLHRNIYAVASEAAGSPLDHTGSSLKCSVVNSLTFSSLDDRFIPTRGIFAKIENEAAGLAGNFSFLKSIFAFKAFASTGRFLTWGISLRSGAILSSQSSQSLSWFDRFVVGGATSVRGLSTTAFGANVGGKFPLGGNVFVEGGASLTVPLRLPNVKAHAFANFGFVDTFSGVEECFRRFPARFEAGAKASVGFGIVAKAFDSVRIEANLAVPLHPLQACSSLKDAANIALREKALHFGFGVEFL